MHTVSKILCHQCSKISILSRGALIKLWSKGGKTPSHLCLLPAIYVGMVSFNEPTITPVALAMLTLITSHPPHFCMQVRSFRNLTKSQALYRLRHYFKFAVIRNPMERLVSAYKNKLERPFDVTFRKKFPDRLKAYILSLYDRKRFMTWISKMDYNQDIHPTFSQFLRFMTKYSLNSYNEHFSPFLQLCFPCAVDYDVVLNFKSINYDIYAAMDYLSIHPSYYPQAIAHKDKPTSDYVQDYFKQVPEPVRTKVFQQFQQELDFYYSLYPEEAGMHNRLG